MPTTRHMVHQPWLPITYVPPAPFDVASDWGTVIGEYDFSVTANITASAGAVSSVAPTSGTIGAIVQSTGSFQPATGATQNGLNVLTFDGGDQLYILNVNNAQPVTSVVVCAADTFTIQRTVTGCYAGGPWIYMHSGGWGSWGGATGMAETGGIDTSWHVVVTIGNGASSELWVDGQLRVSGNVSGAGIDNLAVGASAHGSDPQYWTGKIGHTVYYNDVVADPAGLSIAMKAKWGTV